MIKYIVLCIAVLSLVGCVDDTNGSEAPVPARFEVLEKFKTFDTSTYENGKVIRDRKYGDCYLWLWGGAGNGGVGLERISCPVEILK